MKVKEVWSGRAKAKTWRFDTKLGGKRYRRLGFKTKEEAEDAANDIENVPACAESLKLGSIGAMAEMLVASDLLSQGFDVYRSVSSNGPFDLVAASQDGQTCRIEVKSAVLRGHSSHFSRNHFSRSKHDVLALVFLREQEIEYSQSISEWFANLKKLRVS